MSTARITSILTANLARLIEERGTNRFQLAQACGMSRTGIDDIMKGKSKNPKLDTLEKIADQLGVEPYVLIQNPSRTERIELINRVFDSLPDEEQDRLIATAEAWASLQHP